MYAYSTDLGCRPRPDRFGRRTRGVGGAGAIASTPTGRRRRAGSRRSTARDRRVGRRLLWGVQGVFEHVAGVLEAEAGYAGGEAGTADYESVSGGATGHAESVRITYDPSQITFGEVLRIFFAVATDPTALNRQGPDVGPQYRSAVFAQNPDQQRVAEAYIDQLNRAKAFPDPIVTTVSPQSNFYPAEWYHQNYLELHPDHPYISFYDKPKIDELRRLFPDRYRDQAVLVKRPG